MIIKSHIRAGYRSAAAYLKAQGKNELTRVVEISDPDASDLDAALKNMWSVAAQSKAKKPLHHISINPYKDERLNDTQVLKVVERCEKKYGYTKDTHQRVIVEHVKDGRQHFHVIWNRISLLTGKVVPAGLDWNKSKQTAREMERELGLKPVVPRRMKRARKLAIINGRGPRTLGRYQKLIRDPAPLLPREKENVRPKKPSYDPLRPSVIFRPAMKFMTMRRSKSYQDTSGDEKLHFRRPEWESAEIIAWAFEIGRTDILAEFGIYIDLEP